MSKAGKITAAISGAFLLLIVVAIILIATFDWNRLKPTINQKVSAELNRPFAIRGDLGVVWERQKQETGWRSWVPWPHVHAEDIILGNPPDIPEVTMVHLPRVEATLGRWRCYRPQRRVWQQFRNDGRCSWRRSCRRGSGFYGE